MSAVSREFNYQRRSHRVSLPMGVEIDGCTYQAKDWSVTGVGVSGLNQPLEVGRLYPARCVLPMADSLVALNVELQFRNQRGDVAGFEFHELSVRNKRILRHYIECAIDGKIDNVEDLIAVVTAPGIDTPIDDALTLTDLESEGLVRDFKTKSYISLAVGLLFLVSVVTTLVYNTVFRIQTTGVISGNMERVTANISGVVKQIHVAPNQYVDSGQPLFSLEQPEARTELARLEQLVTAVDRQLVALRAHRDDGRQQILDALAGKRDKKSVEFGHAEQLFAERIISIKDYSYVESQYHQAELEYRRAFEAAQTEAADREREVQQLEQRRAELVAQRDGLRESAAGVTVSAPVRGKVFHIEFNAGEYIAPSDVVVLLEKNVAPVVLMRVSSAHALKIKLGQRALVYDPASDAEYETVVAAVGYASANSGATVTQEASLNETLVRLDFTDPTVRLPANTRVKVWIRTF